MTIFLTPPFQGPDEFNHFFRAYQVSEGHFWGEKTADNRLGGYLPQSLMQTAAPFKILPFHPENTIKKDTLFALLSLKSRAADRIFIDFSNTAVYMPIAYVPAALAIFLGRHLTDNPLLWFYAARIFNLLAWLSVVYISIKTSPVQKWLWTALALLPTSMALHATINPDALCNASAFLLISYFLKFTLCEVGLREKKGATWAMLLVSLCLTAQKLAYVPLLLLLLGLPTRLFGKLKTKVYFISLFVGLHIVVMGLTSLSVQKRMLSYEQYHPTYRVGQQLNEGVNSSAQLHYMWTHPAEYLHTLFYSLFKTAPHTLIHYLGKFGWEKNYLPLPLLFLLFLGLILRGGVPTLTNRQRWLMASAGLLSSLSMATVMYLIWCPVGANFIENLGGKYFIPIIPLFFMSLPSVKMNVNTQKIHQALIIISLFWLETAIFMRYWG